MNGETPRQNVDHHAEFSDFTEESYLSAVKLAKERYRFASFAERPAERHVLWRHDLDVSVHRALRDTQIEADQGVKATYFVYPRSLYYNILHPDINGRIRAILDLGHDLGLHFDSTILPSPISWPQMQDAMEWDRDLLTREFGKAPVAVSFHLFGVLDERPPVQDELCGMVNAYGPTIQSAYDYVSDSNGVWRFRRLLDVLMAGEAERLHVLTHPEWWTPTVMAPRARLQRAIDGYAAEMGRWYDDVVEKSGRPNIR